MPQQTDSLAHDEEADAQTAASRWIETSEGLENSRHLVSRDADSSVVHVDADALARVTATKKNAVAGLRVFNSVADQIAQDGGEKERIAVNRGCGLDYTNADALSQCRNLAFPTNLSKQGSNRHRHQLHPLGMLA
jgi:hypothetical protein